MTETIPTVLQHCSLMYGSMGLAGEKCVLCNKVIWGVFPQRRRRWVMSSNIIKLSRREQYSLRWSINYIR